MHGKQASEQNRLIFQRRDELVVIEAYGRNCLRTRATRNACISDEKTMHPPADGRQLYHRGSEDFATITNGDVKATIGAGFPMARRHYLFLPKRQINFKNYK